MTVVGVAMVRDEEDIIGPVLRHMATQVDAIMILDNRSVDRTPVEIMLAQNECAIPIYVEEDKEVGYQQSAKMSVIADRAYEMFGAEWIVPFDADEIWYGPSRCLADFLRDLPADHDIVEARLFDHVSTALDNSEETNPVERIQWRRSYPAALPKVACRFRSGLVIEMGNHGANYDGAPGKVSGWTLAVRHFPYRSPEQVVRKIRNGAEAYAATDLPSHFGAHWRQWGAILERDGEAAIHDLYFKWHHRFDPTTSCTIDGESQGPLLHDPAPVRG